MIFVLLIIFYTESNERVTERNRIILHFLLCSQINTLMKHIHSPSTNHNKISLLCVLIQLLHSPICHFGDATLVCPGPVSSLDLLYSVFSWFWPISLFLIPLPVLLLGCDFLAINFCSKPLAMFVSSFLIAIWSLAWLLALH